MEELKTYKISVRDLVNFSFRTGDLGVAYFNQDRAAAAVYCNLRQKSLLFAHAPTGIGKTMATAQKAHCSAIPNVHRGYQKSNSFQYDRFNNRVHLELLLIAARPCSNLP